MDFRFNPEDEAFRKELVDFIKKELPTDWKGGWDLSAATEDFQEELRWRRKLADRGWLAMAWPKEYGGQNASEFSQAIFTEEMSYWGAPGQDIFGVAMLGPTLMVHGTEEQKRQFLNKIAKAEMVWCQGYSEPGAGSDLASLQTKAVLDGDDYVINGQKIWTSYAHESDWIFVLARTDPEAPKHKGISFFLVDMKSPGLTVRPIQEMSGRAHFNEVFFDNVRVPKENVLGEMNRGWYVAMTLLDFERSGVEHPAYDKRTLENLVEYAKETKYNGDALIKDPLVRHRLADIAIDIETCRLLAYHIAWMKSKEMHPNYEASVARVLNTTTTQRLSNLGLQLLGLLGQLAPGSKWAPLEGRLEYHYLFSVCYSIESGTSEIQRNIIATRGLGLPR